MLKKNLKHLFLLLAGLFLFGLSLAFYIKSFGVYGDEYGSGFSASEDALVVIVISIVLIAYAALRLFDKVNPKTGYAVTGITISALTACYPLGVFFKKLFKAIEKEEVFEFAAYQNYLFIGIFSLFLLGYFIVYYIENRKSNI